MTRPLDPLAEIKQLYYATTKSTVLRDLDRAIDLLKGLPTEDDRAQAAVYMDGLAQMRSEWGIVSAKPPRDGAAAKTARTARTGRTPMPSGKGPARRVR
jgi:hypothetical protein